MVDVRSGQISEGEYGRAVVPSVVLEHLAGIPRAVAIDTVAARLRSGALRAAAQLIVEIPRRGLRRSVSLRWLSRGDWIDDADDRFWAVGDLTVEPDVLRGSGYKHLRVPGSGATFEVHGVRFDAAGIDERRLQLVEDVATGEALSSPSTGEGPDALRTSTANLEPVSDANLARWYAAFSKLYPPELQTEPNAWAHARATFPKNHVARMRVRKLRGQQRPGPKRGGTRRPTGGIEPRTPL